MNTKSDRMKLNRIESGFENIFRLSKCYLCLVKVSVERKVHKTQVTEFVHYGD